MNIPDFMPVLSAGAHPAGPQTGACVMEYISFLSGDKWTDMPVCTNSVLAIAAQYANDDLPDDRRQELLAFLPRLMNTDVIDVTGTVDWAIAGAAADYVAPLLGHQLPVVHDMARDAQTEYVSSIKPRYVVSSAHLAVINSGGDILDFLSTLIDAYDTATGRAETPVVTEDDFRRLAELTGANA